VTTNEEWLVFRQKSPLLVFSMDGLDIECECNDIGACFAAQKWRSQHCIFVCITKSEQAVRSVVRPTIGPAAGAYITELSCGSIATVTCSAQRKWDFWNEIDKQNENKNSFLAENEKSRKWPNSPLSATKTKTNIGRLLHGLMAWPDWHWPPPPDFTTDLCHWPQFWSSNCLL